MRSVKANMFHEVITEENKQEAAWQRGALVKLICVVTVKPISSDVS